MKREPPTAQAEASLNATISPATIAAAFHIVAEGILFSSLTGSMAADALDPTTGNTGFGPPARNRGPAMGVFGAHIGLVSGAILADAVFGSLAHREMTALDTVKDAHIVTSFLLNASSSAQVGPKLPLVPLTYT